MNEPFLELFLVAVLAIGIWCLVSPAALVALRRRMVCSKSYWNGGFAYATERRTRVTGLLFTAMALLAIAMRFVEK